MSIDINLYRVIPESHITRGSIESCEWFGSNPGFKQLGTMPGFTVELLDPLILTIRGSIQIIAPVGWVTDLTSIPGWVPLSKEGGWTDASIIHDVVYAKGVVGVIKEGVDGRVEIIDTYVTQELADRIYYIAMRSKGVGRVRAAMHYLSLKMFGRVAWGKARRVQNENQSSGASERTG